MSQFSRIPKFYPGMSGRCHICGGPVYDSTSRLMPPQKCNARGQHEKSGLKANLKARQARMIQDKQQRKQFIQTIQQERERDLAMLQLAREIEDIQQRTEYIKLIRDKFLSQRAQLQMDKRSYGLSYPKR